MPSGACTFTSMKNLSTWKNCPVCGDEFRTKTASVCQKCIKNMNNKGYPAAQFKKFINQNKNGTNKRTK